MKIVRKYKNSYGFTAAVSQTRAENSHSYTGGVNYPPTYGIVIDRYKDGTVDVETVCGLILKRVRVAVNEPVCTKDEVVNGKKKLPMPGTKVLILFPDTGTPVVVGSIAMNEDMNDKDNILCDSVEIEKTVLKSGWEKTYNQDNGNIEIKDKDDSQFSLKVDKENKTLSIKTWEGKVSVEIGNDGSISFGNQNATICVSDTGNITMEMNGKVTIKNQSFAVSKAISELWDGVNSAFTELKNLQTLCAAISFVGQGTLTNLTGTAEVQLTKAIAEAEAKAKNPAQLFDDYPVG